MYEHEVSSGGLVNAVVRCSREGLEKTGHDLCRVHPKLKKRKKKKMRGAISAD